MGLLVLLGLSTRAVDSARRLNLDISSSALVGAVALLAPVDPNTKGMVSVGLVDDELGEVWGDLPFFCVLKVPAVCGAGAHI